MPRVDQADYHQARWYDMLVRFLSLTRTTLTLSIRNSSFSCVPLTLTSIPLFPINRFSNVRLTFRFSSPSNIHRSTRFLQLEIKAILSSFDGNNAVTIYRYVLMQINHVKSIYLRRHITAHAEISGIAELRSTVEPYVSLFA